MLGGTILNVEILVGLPGSGKSFYAKKRLDNYAAYHQDKFFGAKVIKQRQVYGLNLDFDKYKDNYPGLKKVINFEGRFNEIFVFHPESLVVCDGLFLTNNAQENLVKEWVDLFNKEGGKDNDNKLNIKFVYFKENREGCLSNDSYREKERRADITIKHSPLEKPDITVLKENFNQENINFEVEEKEVYVMNKYEGLFKPLRNEYWSKKLGKDIMTSERWSTGGTWGDCWGNEGTIGPDKAPDSFKEFDGLLEKYCPEVTFLKYKNIYSKCVTVEEDREHDYYGGTEYFNLYCCDLEKLYEMLTELGYIKED